MAKETKNNEAWRKIWNSPKTLLSKHNWKEALELEHNVIKKITKREIRLLNKNSFDRLDQRPPQFEERDLFLLTHTNDQFVIVKGSKDAYFDFSKEKIQHKNEQTLNIDEYKDRRVGLSIGKSESRALDLAYIIGLIGEFSGHDKSLKLTMRLRHYIDKEKGFECEVGENKNKIKFSGCQYEADAVYESKNNIVIIEMKEKTKTWKEKQHNIKQLYFPFRVIDMKQKELGLNKNVKCFYIFYKFSKDEKEIEYIVADIKFPKNEFKYQINNIYKYKIQLK